MSPKDVVIARPRCDVTIENERSLESVWMFDKKLNNSIFISEMQMIM